MESVYKQSFFKNMKNVYMGKKMECNSFVQLPDFLSSYQLSAAVERTYAVLMREFNKGKQADPEKNRVFIDKEGRLFLKFKRKDIAYYVKCHAKTVGRYIKALVKAGLVADKRNGLGEENYIYLCNHVSVIEEKEEVEEEVPEAIQEQITYVRKALTVITSKKVSVRKIKGILSLGKNNLEYIQANINYMIGRDNILNPLQYLNDALRKDYAGFNKPTAEKKVDSPAQVKKSKKLAAWNQIYKHNWEEEALLKFCHMRDFPESYSHMSKEEYHSKINELHKQMHLNKKQP